MFCNYCRSAIPDGSVFCPVCGQRVEAPPVTSQPASGGSENAPFYPGYGVPAKEPVAVPVSEPAAPASEPAATPVNEPAEEACSLPAEEPAYPGYSGMAGETTVLNYDGSDAQSAYPGYYSSAENSSQPGYEAPAEPADKKPKKGLKTVLLLAGIALVLVAAVVVLLVCFMPGGPVEEIAEGVENTLKAGSFTVEFNGDADGDKISGLFQFELDLDNRELAMYAEVEEDGHQSVMAIYDGYAISEYDGYYYADDISDDLDEIFDQYEEFDLENINWEDLLDSIERGLYDEAEEYIDFDVLNTCLEAYIESLNDEDWLEENAGFYMDEKDGLDLYCFEPDNYVFVSESLAQFEEVFRDEETYEDLEDALKEVKGPMRELELELVFGLDGDELALLRMYGDMDGDALEIELEFSDIGDTEIDKDELKYMLDEAEIY